MKMKPGRLVLECAFVMGGLVATTAAAQPPPQRVPTPVARPAPSPEAQPVVSGRITNTYAAKFVCGVQFDRELDHIREAESGRYSTEIDVHNNSGAQVRFRKKIIALFPDRDHIIGEKPTSPQAKVFHVLKEGEALAVVCRDIYKLLDLPIQVGLVPSYVQGLVIIEVFQPSGAPPPPNDPLDVEGTYTYRGELPVSAGGFPASDSGVSIDVVVYPAKSNGHVMH